jgi:hypothetical protein
MAVAVTATDRHASVAGLVGPTVWPHLGMLAAEIVTRHIVFEARPHVLNVAKESEARAVVLAGLDADLGELRTGCLGSCGLWSPHARSCWPVRS